MKDIVYRTPGKHRGPNGSTYDFCVVSSKDDLDQKLSDGWFESLIEAVAGKQTKPESNEPQEPTREEVLQKATELGLTFHKNIKTAKLRQMVEDKIDELDKATVHSSGIR